MCLPCEYTIQRVKECQIDDIRALFRAAGWWEEKWNDEILCEIVQKSFAFVVASRPDNRWIGMGRIISDGVSDAYLQDIVVLPKWRGHGIGTAIVRKLMTICREEGIGWVGVIAAPETEYFYRKFGFAKMNGYAPMRYEGPLIVKE